MIKKRIILLIMLLFHCSLGSERFGLLNVASPNKEHYSEEDLELLESVAFQIGSAYKENSAN